MKTNCGIYLIRNKANNRLYVGQSATIWARWTHHLSCLRRGAHSNRHLQNAWNKYGEEAFELSIIQHTKRDVNALMEAEQYWIDKLSPEYNIAPVAGSTLGVIHPPRSAEFRKRMRKNALGRRHSKKTISRLREIAKNSNYTHPPEVRKRISEAIKATPFVMTERRRQKYINQRETFYPQAIEAMRKANLGTPLSESTKAKIGAANRIALTGRKLSAEHRKAIGDGNRGKKRPGVGDKLRGKKRPKHVVQALQEGNRKRWAANVARIKEAIAADPDASTTAISKRIGADWATVKKYQQEYKKCQQ